MNKYNKITYLHIAHITLPQINSFLSFTQIAPTSHVYASTYITLSTTWMLTKRKHHWKNTHIGSINVVAIYPIQVVEVVLLGHKVPSALDGVICY